MKKEFLSYDLALELKELGFNEGVLAQYRVDGYLCWGKDDCSLGSDISDEDYKNNCFPEFGCRAALWQQAFRFFREKYKLLSFVDIDNSYRIYCDDIKFDLDIDSRIFKTYEEAELECLVKLIEIAKEQNVK